MFKKIENLTLEQLQQIIADRRAVPLAGFLAANGKARAACMQRHQGWADELRNYTNSIVRASLLRKLANPLSLATLISAIESMGLGLIAKTDLELEEYMLLVAPLIKHFPELIVTTQDWTPVPIEDLRKARPFVQYGLPPEQTRTDATTPKKGRAFRRKEDLETQVAEAVADEEAMMEALMPKVKSSTKDDAIQNMLDAMMARPPAIFEKVTEETIAHAVASIEPFEVVAEILEVEVKSPTPVKPRFLKIMTEAGKFRLKDESTGEYFGEPFTTPIEAIIWASKEGIKIK